MKVKEFFEKHDELLALTDFLDKDKNLVTGEETILIEIPMVKKVTTKRSNPLFFWRATLTVTQEYSTVRTLDIEKIFFDVQDKTVIIKGKRL